MLSNSRMTNKQTFNTTIITDIFDRYSKYECDNIKGYKQHLKTNPNMVELIGGYGQQIKPVFDVDAYNNDIDINAVISKINEVFPEKDVYYAKREPREYKDKGLKYSYRLYVDGVRINYKNLKSLLIENGFDKIKIYDMSIYDKNKILFLPLTTQKEKGSVVPELKLGNTTDIFKCCASYIKEEFEDYDLKFIDDTPKENKETIVKSETQTNEDEDEDENPNKYDRLTTLINKFKASRSEDYNSWIYVVWAILNICEKEKISKRKCYELIHLFSKLSQNYDEDKVDDWIEKNDNKKREKGYGWVYLLHTCVKEDDPRYYENISQSYKYLKKEFERNNCKIIYPPMIVHKDRKGENIIQPIPLCEKSNRHLECAIKETDKKGIEKYKKKRFIELWLNDPTIRKYENYVFTPPPLKVEEYEYNTWTEFDILKTPYIHNQSIIDRLLDYMNNLFNDSDVVNYILAYFANRIQNPAHRNKVCIILYGEEGDGKNRLLDIFKNIFGEKYFTELETSKQLFGSHSCVEQQKLFICVNEAKGKDNYENSDILKARITTDTLMINPKGIQEFKINNYCDYLMTTNNINAVNLHDKSRRYLYVETSSYYSRNGDFFNTFSNDIVENKAALRVIYEYLKSFKIADIIPSGNFQNHIPITEIQKTVIKNNRDKILWFLEDMISGYFEGEDLENETEIKIKNKELFIKWNSWVERNKIDIKYNNIAFHSRIGQLMKKQINADGECITKDTNSNTYIYVSKLRAFFEKLNQ